MWHASVALQNPLGTGLVPLMLWGKREHAEARELTRSLLSGVGTGVTKIGRVPTRSEASYGSPSPSALHAKRVLSDAEQERLTPEWCALPAIDEEGGVTLETAEW